MAEKETVLPPRGDSRCCAVDADFERLICRLSAHDSYGASATTGTDCRDGKDDAGEAR